MKKIITGLLLILCFQAAKSQYTYIAQRYDWLAGKFRALNIPAGDSAQFQALQDRRSGALYYDSTGVDSGLYVWSGLVWRKASEGGFFTPDQTSTGNTSHNADGNNFGVNNIGDLVLSANNTNLITTNDLVISGDSVRFNSTSGRVIFPNLLTDSDTTTYKSIGWDAATGRVRAMTYWPGGGGGNLLFDSLGTAGISPMTTWNNTLYARRISVSGGSIDTTASGGLLITVSGGITDGDKGDITVSGSGTTWDVDAATIGITELSATGTPSSSTFLAGDNTWKTVSAAPGGSNTQIQFNNSGSFGGSSALVWDNTNNSVSIAGGSTAARALSISKTATLAEEYVKLFPASGSGQILFSDGASSGYLPTLTMQPDGTTQNNTNLIFRANDSGTPANAVFTARNFAGSGGLSTKPLFDFQNFTTSVFKLNADNSGTFTQGTLNLGVAGTAKGILKFGGNTSGTVTIQPAAAAGTYTLTLPTDDGNSGDLLKSDGSGVLSFVSRPQSKNITIESPTTSEDLSIFYTDVAITVTKLADVLRGSSPSVTYQINHATDRSSGSPNTLFSSDRTSTSTTGATTTTFNDATIPAGSWVWVTTSANSGTINDIAITLTYTQD